MKNLNSTYESIIKLQDSMKGAVRQITLSKPAFYDMYMQITALEVMIGIDKFRTSDRVYLQTPQGPITILCE